MADHRIMQPVKLIDGVTNTKQLGVILTADAVANSTTGGILMIGSDGSNYRALATSNAGVLSVSAAQSGTWNITNISGTVSLPTGASTAAKQPALGTAGTASADVITVQGIASMTALTVTGTGGTFPVTDSGGSLTVDNGGTFAVQATIAAGATNIAKAEDVGSADGDVGVPALAVRKATPANTSGTDGDYEFLQMSAGRLWVSATIDAALPAGTNGIGKLTANSGVTIGAVEIAAAQTLATVTTVGTVTTITNAVSVSDNGGSLTVDNAGTFAVQDSQAITDNGGFTDGTSKVFVAGYIFDEVAGTALTENDAAAARIDAKRAVVSVLEDGTTRGQRAAVSAGGALSVSAAQSGTWNITNISGTVSLPTGASTAAKQPALGTAGTASADVITVQGIASMTALVVDSELPAAAALADAAANPTVPAVGSYLVGYNGTTWDRVRTANTGRLQVDVITGGGSDSPTSPAYQNLTSAALAAGASANLDTTDITSKYLYQVDVSSSVAFKAIVSTLTNGSATVVTVLFGKAGDSITWRPPHRTFAQSGSTAGADGFRVAMTNLDTSDAADVYATVYYANN